MMTSQINPCYVGKTYLTREWFHENIRGKDTLLITIGDSWTWGDGLGIIDMGKHIYDDYDYRVAHVFGNLLSNKLDTDWVNIGMAGSSNLQIFLEAHNFIQGITKSYKKIFVVITLTETGRELYSNNILDKQEDYNNIKNVSWPNFKDMLAGDNASEIIKTCIDNNIELGYDIELYHAIKDYRDLHDLLVKYETYTFNLIKRFFTSYIVGRNFTHTIDSNKPILEDKLLSKIWTNVIAEQGGLDTYPNNIRILSKMGIEPILKFANNLPREELINLIDLQELGYSWLVKSPYNFAAGTKHPNKLAHRWWADYLYENIKL